ncbi:hypothetical protein BKA70DRAFT_124307 [Coprinopsis sp. MPI-PUGE-AT-0042]|nr:hypothetical protein BKA70DRAFT_124307 [Coprinopsis sp. MPI-PUGE-AT-0042]
MCRSQKILLSTRIIQRQHWKITKTQPSFRMGTHGMTRTLEKNDQEVTKPDEPASTNEVNQDRQSTTEVKEEIDPNPTPCSSPGTIWYRPIPRAASLILPPRQPRRIPSPRSHLSTRPLSKSPKLQLLLLSNLLLLLRLLVPVPHQSRPRRRKRPRRRLPPTPCRRKLSLRVRSHPLCKIPPSLRRLRFPPPSPSLQRLSLLLHPKLQRLQVL